MNIVHTSEGRLSSLFTLGNNLNVWFGNFEKIIHPRSDISILSAHLEPSHSEH